MAWYNGHPDYRDLEFDLSGRRAVVIGNGNVAADVTRMLTLSPDELARTDVADHALEALRESRIEEVVVLGRRGPAQAAFTSAELRELGRMDGVDLRVDPAEIELDPLSAEWLAEDGTFTARKNVELLREFAAREPQADAPRADRAPLPALARRDPRRGRGGGDRHPPQRDRALRRRHAAAARPPDEELETIECGLVLRSVGYRAVPLPGVPFDERSFILPNDRGRVLDAGRRAGPGRLRRGLDQARPHRHPRHQQARRRGDRDPAGRGPGRAAPARRRRTPVARRSTPCSPSASPTWSRSTPGARSTRASSRRACRQERPRVKLASREELLAAAQSSA